ncbi:MAG: hypothetical protein RMK97_04490 [Sutterellaceae bacterium]|nr:hypothetical protein [Burkholderiaceae bacterium]MCX7900910.1 hypothetical protein [Burkholderiaceae bacterium]MDW8429750.1 hypothetical protein [Sutterellaceae bacterium]
MGRVTDTTPSTDFVVTTVNVPDRLDVQEVRARADEESQRRERFNVDWYAVRVWLLRVLLLGLVLVAGWVAWQHSEPFRAELAPARIAQRLGAGAGLAVHVGDTRIQWLPSPRFIVEGLELGNAWRAEAVSVLFNWEDAWRALQRGGWTWGEARVGPTALSLDQLSLLVQVLPAIGAALPQAIASIRFESIELTGPLVPSGPFEAVVRRQVDGAFGTWSLRSLRDNLTVNLWPSEGGEGVRFQFDGASWQATVGPPVQWSEARGYGLARAGFVEVSEFLLAGYFGSIRGSLFAAADQFWAVTGFAVGANLDIESFARPAGGGDDVSKGGRRGPAAVAGTLDFDLLISGEGASLEEAVAGSRAAGPFKVRWATIHGINLGYVATRPGSVSGGGGTTRFTDFNGWLVLGPAGASLQDLHARAGALTARGQVTIKQDGSLTGRLRVDLGGDRVQAPLSLRVAGTAAAPEFVR